MQIKKNLRTVVKKKLKEMSAVEHKNKSEKIKEHLNLTTLWKEANTIAITISRGTEVDTYKIIENAWREGKKIVVPKTYPEKNEMVFFQINSFNELESTYFQLKEPKETVCLPKSCEDIDLILVPGVAFDRKGNRLGFGGGYYDRYLAHYKGKTCALAFEEQLVSEIPVESFDVPVQMIVTEDQVYKC
ncbi:5-formyltetrahydrofolate cyclo-ligase [Alkalihalobacterium chitinilyticum]|uniref:5-formyltetrahydrofolate cyclo-ligase n=1 Tax=Alkalihalobacterium chitinilyticum TaxID=2980103 RepID=A0ABT5VEQ8_9BACI|nr:5-formyltetrahydrofolate cyclo-ligase [Alkalihalobacterium chitinilyticum]MDE5413948.1 5-formyltetrahydrofolate cyclo-ligase [Alkalihalobacterium chitinilyticum]